MLQYLQLFAPQKSMNRFMWYCARIIIVANGIYYIFGSFIRIITCPPRKESWNPLLKHSRCSNNNLRIFFTCGYNILLDVIILILPSRAVWKLWIPTRKKVDIVLMFAIGLLYVAKTRCWISNTDANTFDVAGRALLTG